MHVVVVGASVAGVTLAEALRSAGHAGPITLVGAEPHAPYARPPLSKQVLDGTWEPARTALRTRAELHALDVTLRTGAAATALDTVRHQVVVDGAALPYDVLVIATGTEAVRPELPGRSVHVLRTLDDAVTLRRAWSRSRHVAVLGSGVLGSELASAARAADRAVTVIGRSGTLTFGTVGTLLSDRLAELHRSHGVQLRLTAGATGAAAAVDECGADLVVAAIGSRPATAWLADSGLAIDDGVLCDASGRAAPDVYAVGDVARWADARTGRAVRVEHQTNAIEQALAVAATITGAASAPSTPFFWSEVHGVRIQAAGVFDDATLLDPSDEDPRILRQRSGVVGWGAPRAFRLARATLDRVPSPA
ncbi:FAD-dependent oxidoreductase [Curtobacterium sp. MCPF17_002]|uniref:NAD(P)/FAD-dependent oxidoreductase n=1 Tax=Curtobacterium sp. MCPF17_002 TaxID=2175645 RepID=UPI001C654495|nr:FAD-dependent oxidoreductase [Curtobacterium sp. MCPF17_002]WIB76652.1 FAD-dependent oxidoreductase [Curtobacterium sp. MCPF17_002]